ncbi:MAG: dethiobiotin synthase [Planctomycetaceae bacterium]|nr:dethiobiotin synthase [Planctomycetaceae bacterium]
MLSTPSGKRPPRGLFVCGTGTDVGKTYVSCLIARNLTANNLKVGAYKPVASGAVAEENGLISSDAVALQRAAGCDDLLAVCPQIFEAPLAPPVAAALESREVDQRLLRTGLTAWTSKCDFVVVEGIGGLLSPVSDDASTITLVREFGYPVILVAADRLGVVNDVRSALCVCDAYAPDIPVAGIVLNQVSPSPDASCASNAKQIRQHTQVPLLAQLKWQSPAPLQSIDWQAIAAIG